MLYAVAMPPRALNAKGKASATRPHDTLFRASKECGTQDRLIRAFVHALVEWMELVNEAFERQADIV